MAAVELSSGVAEARDDAGARPRLLILTPDFPPAHGGVQALVHGLALAMNGFQTEVVTLDAPGAQSFDEGGPLVTTRISTGMPPRARMVALNAAAVVRAQRFRPHVTLCAHVITSPAGVAIRRLIGARTAQYFYANEILGRPRLAAFAAANADVVIAISAYTASLVAATSASPQAITVIPPGVELPGATTASPTGRPTVLTIAQLKHSYKGHDVLIDALAGVRSQVPDVEWIIIGEGPLRVGLEARAAAHGLTSSVRFLGEVSDAQRDSWLRRADVFAMPSRLPGEGFGIAYLEASAHGLPVLAANIGGPLDAVVHGVSGLLVDPTDTGAIEEALTKLLLDREMAASLGRGGAARAREFAWPLIAARVEAALLAPAGARL